MIHFFTPVSRLRMVCLLLAALAPPTVTAAPQAAPDKRLQSYAGRPVVTAVRMDKEEAVTLDGRLDESAWQRATPAADFIQFDPVNGAPPTERTEVRFLYDRYSLYMGVSCFDSEPDKLLGNTMQRDAFLSSDDRFMWSFDPLLNGRTGYFFEINPSGAMGDSLIGGSNAREWDGVWNAKIRRSQTGWTAEIEISFRTLNFDPAAPGWGVNFQRTVRRKNEESLWTGWGRNQGLRKMSNAGLLVGIEGVSQGLGFDVKPYVIGKFFEAPGRGQDSTLKGTGGVDLIYSVTPRLKANFTVNTDFAETEVDQRRVNLTRFSLFFPEKRVFFVEGAGFFDFAREPENAVVPFFSRRIGLDENGRPQKIDYGVKLTGQAGAQDVGLLHVRTAPSASLSGENFTALRLKRRFWAQSYLGALYTRRSGYGPLSASADQYTAGFDFQLATASFRRTQNLEFGGFYLRNTDMAKTGGNDAYGLRLEFPNDRWNGTLAYRQLGRNYAPAVGFTDRNGYRRLTQDLAFSHRPKDNPWIRRLTLRSDFQLIGDTDNRLITRELELTLLEMDLHSGDSIEFKVVPTVEQLERDFTISRGVVLRQGTRHEFTRYWVEASTANRRPVAISSTYKRGSFFSGHRREFEFNLGIRPRPGLIFTLNPEWNRVELAEGHFSTSVLRGSANIQLNPWVAMTNNVQYDSVSRVAGWQFRFRWILKPGTDLFFVYVHNWLHQPGLFTSLDRDVATKFVYTHRF